MLHITQQKHDRSVKRTDLPRHEVNPQMLEFIEVQLTSVTCLSECQVFNNCS